MMRISPKISPFFADRDPISSSFLGDADLSGEQKVKPGVHVPFLNDGLAILILADLAQAQQLAQVAGFEMTSTRKWT
jgi:hypothetical protein